MRPLVIALVCVAACNRQPDEPVLRPGPGAAPPPPGSSASGPARIAASHVLVAWAGSGAGQGISRTRDEARQRIDEVLQRARAGEDFAALAARYSDEPGHETRRGDLGDFGRGAMVPPFERAAFALQVGEVSGVVETQFGFHVIKRTR